MESAFKVCLRTKINDQTAAWFGDFPTTSPKKTYSKALVRIGVDDFATSNTNPQLAIRIEKHKLLHFADDDRVELYDLNHDTSEFRDLIPFHPLIAAKLRDEVHQQLVAMKARREVPHR